MTPDRALDRARTIQPALNLFTHLEDTVGTGHEGPLAGVPVALKDLIDHEGRVTTCGSAFYRHLATVTATCVRRLESSGGVIIGRAGLHEWAFGFSSENPHWGAVRNPWDPRTSPGGSSGGSAAAVAAGITPLAIGTDTGGSVRVPAALCGVFGLKVTHGTIPLDGVFPLVPTIDTVGPLASSMEMLERGYRAMADDHRQVSDPERLRFGIPEPWYSEAPIHQDVAVMFEGVVEALRGLGHTVETVTLGDVVPDRRIIMWALAREVDMVHREFRERGELYGEDVATRLDEAAAVTDDQARAGRDWQQMIRQVFADSLREVDYLITPTVPVRRKVIGEESINGHHYRAVLSYFSAIVNHALLPALAMPVRGSGSPPLSLQVIGPSRSEPGLLALGHSLETAGLVGFEKPEIEIPARG